MRWKVLARALPIVWFLLTLLSVSLGWNDAEAWDNTNFAKRRAYTIDGGYNGGSGPGSLDNLPKDAITNYVVYVPIKCSDDIDCSIVRSDGFDVIFYDGAGTLLKFERVGTFSTTAHHINEFWVRLNVKGGTCSAGSRSGLACSTNADCPSSSCSNGSSAGHDIIYAYYGYASATNTADAATTWSNYKILEHLPDGTTLSVTDSTGNYSPTNGGATAVAGQLDGAAHGDGASGHSIVQGAVLFANNSHYRLSAWFKPAAKELEEVLDTRGTAGCGAGTVLYMDATGKTTAFQTNNDSTIVGTTDLTASGGWHLIESANDGTTHRLFVDGVQEASAVHAPPSNFTGSSFQIFIDCNSAYYKANVDEARFSVTSWTPAISVLAAADWNSQRNNCNAGTDPVTNNCFLTFGAEEAQATPTATATATATITPTATATGTATHTGTPTATHTADPGQCCQYEASNLGAVGNPTLHFCSAPIDNICNTYCDATTGFCSAPTPVNGVCVNGICGTKTPTITPTPTITNTVPIGSTATHTPTVTQTPVCSPPAVLHTASQYPFFCGPGYPTGFDWENYSNAQVLDGTYATTTHQGQSYGNACEYAPALPSDAIITDVVMTAHQAYNAGSTAGGANVAINLVTLYNHHVGSYYTCFAGNIFMTTTPADYVFDCGVGNHDLDATSLNDPLSSISLAVFPSYGAPVVPRFNLDAMSTDISYCTLDNTPTATATATSTPTATPTGTFLTPTVTPTFNISECCGYAFTDTGAGNNQTVNICTQGIGGTCNQFCENVTSCQQPTPAAGLCLSDGTCLGATPTATTTQTQTPTQTATPGITPCHNDTECGTPRVCDIPTATPTVTPT